MLWNMNVLLLEPHPTQGAQLSPLTPGTQKCHVGPWAILVHPVQLQSLLRKPFYSAFYHHFAHQKAESVSPLAEELGLHSAGSQWGKKPLCFSSVQKRPTLGSLCKMHFYPDLSIATGLFPCLVGYQCVGWGCFILIYWYLNLLSATMVNSTLVPQTLWTSWVSCKRLNRDEVEEQ